MYQNRDISTRFDLFNVVDERRDDGAIVAGERKGEKQDDSVKRT